MPEPTPPKPLLQSKTVIVNAIIAFAAFIPSVQAVVQAHPTEVLIGLSLLNGALRLITKGRIVLFAE